MDLSKIKMRKLVITGFGIVALVVTLSSLFSAFLIHDIKNHIEEIRFGGDKIAASTTLRFSTAMVWQFITDASLTKDREVINTEAKEYYDQAIESIDKLLTLHIGDKEKTETLTMAKQHVNSVWSVGLKMFEAYSRSQEEGNIAMDEFDVATDNSIKAVNSFVKEIVATRDASIADLDERGDRLFTVSILSLTLVLLASVGLAWFVYRRVVQSSVEMEKVAANVLGASDSLNAVSHQLSASSEETATQANVVSAAAEQVSKNVQTVSTNVEQMNLSIREISKSTSEASRVAQDAVGIAQATNQSIAKLGESSNEIGNVIKVITSIAEQTNLLALNATIEAARAGEAGKGFAVVANEVKELAKQTAKATEDISRRIEAIQGDSGEAIKSIEQISHVIGQINDMQSTVASAIEEQSATSSEITRNIEEAAKGSSEIAQNITGVAQAAQSVTTGASETQGSSSQLSQMATELKHTVEMF